MPNDEVIITTPRPKRQTQQPAKQPQPVKKDKPKK